MIITLQQTVTEKWSTRVQKQSVANIYIFYFRIHNIPTKTASITLNVTVNITIKWSNMTAPYIYIFIHVYRTSSDMKGPAYTKT